MNRILASFTLLGCLSWAAGCALCPSPFDGTYAAYGGRWQRHDRAHGRVGSAFAPAGAQISVSDYAPEELLPVEPPAEELYEEEFYDQPFEEEELDEGQFQESELYDDEFEPAELDDSE